MPNPPPNPNLPNRAQKGQQGEQLAKKHLQNKGYHFLAQNFRTHSGEIDLIFQHQAEIVFVEVKTRRSLAQGIPEEAVTPHKLHKITQVAQQFLEVNHLHSRPARIDVVAVELTTTPPTIRHLINVSQ